MAAPHAGAAESVKRVSDQDEDSKDSEDDYEVWIPDRPINRTLETQRECKGCGEKYKFVLEAGRMLTQCETVMTFYNHCLQCVEYAQKGLARVCKRCHRKFINEEQQNLHMGQCNLLAFEWLQKNKNEEQLQQKKPPQKQDPKSSKKQEGPKPPKKQEPKLSKKEEEPKPPQKQQQKSPRKRVRESSPTSNGSPVTKRRASADSSDSDSDSDSDDESADQGVMATVEDEDLIQQVQRAAEKMIAKNMAEITQIKTQPQPVTVIKPAVRRPGPKSRTMAQPASPVANGNIRTSVSPTQTAVNGSASASASCGSSSGISSSSSSGSSSGTSSGSSSGDSPSTSSSSGPSQQMNNNLPPVLPLPRRPGPKSRTMPPESMPGAPIQRAPVAVTPDAIRAVQAKRNMSGKDLSHLQRSLKSRRNSTPSSMKTKKAKKQTPKKRKRAASSSEGSDRDSPVPEFIKQLPKVKLTRAEYFIYIPSRAKSSTFFNAGINCNACDKRFLACMPDGTAAGMALIPDQKFYHHCLKECDGYLKNHAKYCDTCCHIYLNENELSAHKKSRICHDLTKKVNLLYLRMPWMQFQQYWDLLFLNLNSDMLCPGCKTSFGCNKKGNVYSPGLELQCHMIDACPAYIALDKIVECRGCVAGKNTDVFYYVSEKEYKKYDPCAQASDDSSESEDERNDPNSPYYGKGKGKGK